MKTKLIFLSIVLLLLAANVPAQKQSPGAVVRSFYKFHSTRPNVFKASEVALYKKWFSPELNKLFQNELKREKEYLKKNPTDKPHFGDGFPFGPLDECYKNKRSYKNTYKIVSEAMTESTAFIEIAFYQPKICGGEAIENYKVNLFLGKTGWLIDDWTYPDGHRLSEDLKRAEY